MRFFGGVLIVLAIGFRLWVALRDRRDGVRPARHLWRRLPRSVTLWSGIAFIVASEQSDRSGHLSAYLLVVLGGALINFGAQARWYRAWERDPAARDLLVYMRDVDPSEVARQAKSAPVQGEFRHFAREFAADQPPNQQARVGETLSRVSQELDERGARRGRRVLMWGHKAGRLAPWLIVSGAISVLGGILRLLAF